MRTRPWIFASFLAALLPASLLADASPSPSAFGYSAAEPNAPEITQKNLFDSERFWPYRVSLVAAWQPPGHAKALRKGDAGVLVRVEKSGVARIDFGGEGVIDTPVAHTDLIRNANRIRIGELDKLAPNFLAAVGPRLVDPRAETPRGMTADDLLPYQGYLCVFADVNAEGFDELARALAPLNGLRGVATVLFPQGPRRSDVEISKRLRELEWRVPFVFDYLSEGYTDSLVGAHPALPLVLLQTNEGRAVFQGRWQPTLTSEIRAKLDQAFGTSVGLHCALLPRSLLGADRVDQAVVVGHLHVPARETRARRGVSLVLARKARGMPWKSASKGALGNASPTKKVSSHSNMNAVCSPIQGESGCVLRMRECRP
jgi:hypothetical protein